MPKSKGRLTAFIVHPILQRKLDAEAQRAEAVGLAAAIDIHVIGLETVNVAKPTPGFLLGEGGRESLVAKIQELSPDVVIVNHALSPVQQRNLEKLWQAKVIDRTGLILEIFGARAQTREGKIQVELAALNYQRSRLVRSWTHLERQRGGGGFMGGPGETQIELDRRLIDDRITHLKKQLEDVRRTRGLQADQRKKVPFRTVSLVGYTNAGKSTLFNRLTDSNVFAKDLLFATLDPTVRKLKLPSGQYVMMSDTVGFISNLPTHLIAAFRATLEQIEQADIILHVRDMSSPDTLIQKKAVEDVLSDLGVQVAEDDRVIEVCNKMDRLGREDRDDFKAGSRKILVSALTGTGLNNLLQVLSEKLSDDRSQVRFKIPVTDGDAMAWLYQNGKVTHKKEGEENITFTVNLDKGDVPRFQSRFGYKPLKAKASTKKI